MISERELRQVAGRYRLGVGQAEHEYVILCAFDALAETPALAEAFCLKGGTALRQMYFADWRHSVDLDFSVLPGFSSADLEIGLTAWLDRTKARHGIEIVLRDFHRANGAARLRARFLGPLRHPGRLLLDITLDEPVLLPPQRRQVVVDLFAWLRPTVLVYALEEILAEKLRSVLQRGKARDYYDVWRLLKEKGDQFDQRTARQILQAKCQRTDIPEPTREQFLSPSSLAEAGAYWRQDLAEQVPGVVLFDWNTVVHELHYLLTDFLA